MLHVAAFEQGPSLGWARTRPLAVKTSKELLAPEFSISEDIKQKPSCEQNCKL
jgi:hypothetical protein